MMVYQNTHRAEVVSILISISKSDDILEGRCM